MSTLLHTSVVIARIVLHDFCMVFPTSYTTVASDFSASAERRSLVQSIRDLDVRYVQRSFGGAMQTQNKGRNLLGRNMMQTK